MTRSGSASVAAASPALTCTQVVELVTDYLEGGLSEADRARFEAAPERLRRLHELPRPDPRHDRRRRPRPRGRSLRRGEGRAAARRSGLGVAMGDAWSSSSSPTPAPRPPPSPPCSPRPSRPAARSWWPAAPRPAGRTSSRPRSTATGAASISGSATTAACRPYDPLSNQLLVQESLLDRIIVHPTVHAIPTELSPDEAAAAYDAELRDEPLDLVLLGLGSDGHTASLFPDAPSARRARPPRRRRGAGARSVRRAGDADDPGARVGRARGLPRRRRGARRTPSGARSASAPSKATPASLVRSRDGQDDRHSRRRCGVAPALRSAGRVLRRPERRSLHRATGTGSCPCETVEPSRTVLRAGCLNA